MPKYEVMLSERFIKEFREQDKYTQRMLKAWIKKNLEGCTDPGQHRKGLSANRSGQWRYRIGDYRIICTINDGSQLVILALTVGYRRDFCNS